MRPALPQAPVAASLELRTRQQPWADVAKAAGRGGSMGGVPTISRFFGISIAMFFDDHGPPHFHARHAQGNAKAQIDSLEVIGQQPPSPPTQIARGSCRRHLSATASHSERCGCGKTAI
jgi:hypothetical protein